MCDEDHLARWAREGLNRRQFGALGGAAALAACTSSNGDAREAGRTPESSLIERTVSFPTADGTMDGFFVHPGTGKAPAVLFWPDIAGIREAKRAMARRLAGSGYAVLLANPYYRDVAGEQFADFADFAGNGGFQKVTPWRARFTADSIMRDATAAIGWLDRQDAVDATRGVGTQGYCMTGSFAIYGAAAVPSRVKAAASCHGGGLVREGDPQSPDKMIGKSQASFLIAIGQNDDAKSPGDKDVLREAAKAAGRPADVAVYPADHGWCVPDSPSYDKEQAEIVWAKLLALYKSQLA